MIHTYIIRKHLKIIQKQSLNFDNTYPQFIFDLPDNLVVRVHYPDAEIL